MPKIPKVISVVGRSGSGKTTLITSLIPCFVTDGLKTGSIKHTHHDVELDKKGKDSWKHRQAGSSQVLLLTHGKMALYGEYRQEESLAQICSTWFKDFDLVISEGFKNEDCFKIEVTRRDNDKPPLYLEPEYNIQAVVADYPLETDLPVFGMDEITAIHHWLRDALKRL